MYHPMKSSCVLPFRSWFSRWKLPGARRCFRLILLAGLASAAPASAALIDVWRAEDLGYNDGDSVTTWTSASNRVANAVVGSPVFRKNATPAGGAVVRFNRNRLGVGSSPVGGRTAFSIAVVFRMDAVGASDSGANWYGKTGLLDAEQGGVTADWGTVVTETGNVGIGIGSPDTSLYSTGASMVDGSYHVAVFAWGGGQQAVQVDARARVSVASPSAARNSAGFSMGGIQTDENGSVRRFVGDLAEVRFYDTALDFLQASNVISELREQHVVGNLPRIKSFAATTNFIYLGGSATLSWDVTNAANVSIDPGLGNRPAIGSVSVSPALTTTYSLTATNTNGVRTASVTIVVDPGVPTALGYVTNVAQGASVPIALRGTDPNGGVLTYAIVTPPANGALSGAPPNVTYTPNAGFFGFDAFTFKVNDGAFDSAPATVSIKVVPPPMPPTGVALSTAEISASAGPGAFLATIRAIDPNEFDTHVFSLVPGFGDNARFVVNGNRLVAGPTFVSSVGNTFSLRLRATDNTGFSVEQTLILTVTEPVSAVLMNEVHYNSPQNTVREEFIELHNASGAPVDLSNWRLRGGVDFFFPAGTTIAAGGFLVVGESPATLMTRFGVTALGPWSGGLNKDGEELALRNAAGDLMDRVDFRSEFPWPVAANGEGPSMQLVHPALDNDLGSSWRSARPTPGATNAVYAASAAPNIRQVDHAPQTPAAGQPVAVTAKVTDPQGVRSVVLAYQIVLPGAYLPAFLPLTTPQLNNLNTVPLTNAWNPAFEASTNWTAVTMRDDGLNGDAVAGDDIYTAVIPPQANRTLIRYRITSEDTLGTSRRAPFEDDPSLNFACFVYDGVPGYLGFPASSLQTLPVFTLLTRDAELQQCAAWFNTGDQLGQNGPGGSRNEGRFHFNWEGTMVYDGEVYDHVRYRLRGANGRYHPGKRSFRIRFNEGRLLDAKDQTGRRFPTKWRELTTGKGQGNRGSVTYALNEVVNYFLWNKVGVPAPATLHFHFRVVRGAQESPSDPYAGDFWGLNWAQEKYDVNFLEAHDLPAGNLYKLVDNFVLGVDERRYQAPFAVTNAEDFFNLENNLDGFKSTEWLLAHANYSNWFRYFTVAEAIRHYDTWPSANKNGSWYFEPIYGASNSFFGRAMQLPYDSTDTWGPTWNTGEDILFNGIFPSSAPGGDQGQNPGLQLQYRNVVRELRDLLFQPDQIHAIIDAHATPLLSVAAADFARWSNAPAPANYVSVGTAGGQSPGPGNRGGLPAYIQDLKNFMFVGGNNAWWLDRNSVAAGGWITRLDAIAGADTAGPGQPSITYVGTNGYPVDGLVFASSAFADPQGNDTFGAMQWRVAEVLPTNVVVTSLAELRLELDAVWQSGVLTAFDPQVAIPAGLLAPERLYRARVRHQDNTGRWSRWSAPVEFRPRAADVFASLKRDLVFAEIMYNPPADGGVDGDEFEFIELKNRGTNTLDLTGLFFSAGVNFAFPNGTKLAPGGLFLLARNPAQLANRSPGVTVQGVYSGRLDNGGERLAIEHPVAGVITEVTYGDRAPWPVAADGFGFSLVLVDGATGAYGASAAVGGSPGTDGGASLIGGVVINEVLSSTTDPLRDAVELLNVTGGPIDIGGWYLTDDPTFPWKFQIPPGTTLAAGEFRVFDEEQFNATPGSGGSFSLNSFGDDVYLFSSAAPGTLSGYSHGVTFGAAQDGVSFGRHLNSVGEEQFPLQIARTLGGPNAGPRVGPVVISEIHYHPGPGAAAAPDEFVELRNVSGAAAAMFDAAHPTNTWRVGGIDFAFPAGVTLPAGGSVLLVSDAAEAFRARRGVAPATPVFQYTGNLQDSGEKLELLAPDTPATNGVPYFAVDTVRYNDRKPWPLAADGAGASLQKITLAGYGNDPIQWLAAVPTPGSHGVSGEAPVITAHPTSTVGVVGGPATFSAAASGTGPLRYQWRFDGANLEGATNATLVIPSVQFSDAGPYQVVVFNAAGSTDSSNATLVVRVGANISRPPADVQVRIPPDPGAAPTTNVTFSVGYTTFNPPVRLQWQFNGIDLPVATNVSLTVSNVQLANEGAYRVLVTDGVGTVASPAATLLPLIATRLVDAPISQSVVQGGLVGVSATASGHPLPFSWEWRRGSVPMVIATNQGRSSLISFINTNAPGTQSYRVIVKNLANNTLGANAAFSIITVADADADGLPDEWETQYFGSATGANAGVDDDGDGVSNGQEYTAGTNPANAGSFLKVSLTLTSTPMISFGAESNKTYTIQFAPEAVGPWQALTNVLARPASRVESVLDPLGPGRRFYRVVTPAQP